MQIPARFCHVALFVPNLIGYLRLVLLAAAFCTGVSAPQLTYCLFLVNLLLDGLDGIVARRLNQVCCLDRNLLEEQVSSYASHIGNCHDI